MCWEIREIALADGVALSINRAYIKAPPNPLTKGEGALFTDLNTFMFQPLGTESLIRLLSFNGFNMAVAKNHRVLMAFSQPNTVNTSTGADHYNQ